MFLQPRLCIRGTTQWEHELHAEAAADTKGLQQCPSAVCLQVAWLDWHGCKGIESYLKARLEHVSWGQGGDAAANWQYSVLNSTSALADEQNGSRQHGVHHNNISMQSRNTYGCQAGIKYALGRPEQLHVNHWCMHKLLQRSVMPSTIAATLEACKPQGKRQVEKVLKQWDWVPEQAARQLAL